MIPKDNKKKMQVSHLSFADARVSIHEVLRQGGGVRLGRAALRHALGYHVHGVLLRGDRGQV